MYTLLLSLLVGCEGDVVVRPATPAPQVEVTEVGTTVTPEAQAGRVYRRMTIPQLADSIERVTNGIRWMDDDDDLFEDLSATLGVPDFIERTDENLSPDLVFQKFLDDAAATVCVELVDREGGGSADNVLLVGVDLATRIDEDRPAIEAALSQALLRFHGRTVPVGDPALAPWTWLFESTTFVSDADTEVAWQSVCTALIVHPHFYTF